MTITIRFRCSEVHPLNITPPYNEKGITLFNPLGVFQVLPQAGQTTIRLTNHSFNPYTALRVVHLDLILFPSELDTDPVDGLPYPIAVSGLSEIISQQYKSFLGRHFRVASRGRALL